MKWPAPCAGADSGSTPKWPKNYPQGQCNQRLQAAVKRLGQRRPAHRKGARPNGRAPERDEPVLIPMYAETSWRPPPSRPFLDLLCFPLCTALAPPLRSLAGLSTDVVGAFCSTRKQRCQAVGHYHSLRLHGLIMSPSVCDGAPAQAPHRGQVDGIATKCTAGVRPRRTTRAAALLVGPRAHVITTAPVLRDDPVPRSNRGDPEACN